MLLTRDEQRETLHAAAREMGVRVGKHDVDWRDGSVNVNGLNLHYLDWGTEGNQPMLLLHGGLQQAHSWDIVAVALKQGYHVVALDLRGHGDSDWSQEADYGYAAHASDVQGLIEHLGWERYVLMGMSLGGLASIDLAASAAPLDALVLVDVGPELNASGAGRIAEFGRASAGLQSIEEYIEKAMAYNPRRSPALLRYSLTHSLKQREDGSWGWKYDKSIAGKRRETADASNDEQMIRGYLSDLWQRITAIACPTLVVRGGDSEVFLEKTGRRMQETMPDCTFVTVPDAGHTVPQDNPAAFLAAIIPFLQEHGLP
jgi:pimeloyl-ACP methyl ester carboxylesterase